MIALMFDIMQLIKRRYINKIKLNVLKSYLLCFDCSSALEKPTSYIYIYIR